ncbi:Bsp6I family type II restriction endonuclease [Clostridium celatum]|uniref:Bsp6I family type II restriction endonuclease n=1 Tax=Clostridium celatum TaxID=36834 RepID=UPI00189AF4FD|nr:Bsp6I family type II restriction endonuclease [Clostridium celatum]
MNLDLVFIDKSRFLDAIKAYFLWKELDTIIRTSHTRGINIPETITETLLCYVSNFQLNKGSGGDAFDTERNKVVEIKATSNYDRDTSSFSPKEEFDALYFVRLDKREDIMYFYDLEMNSEDLKLIQVNSTQTLVEQQRQGRRPRFSIIKFIIEKHGLEPYAKLDLRTKKIYKLK